MAKQIFPSTDTDENAGAIPSLFLDSNPKYLNIFSNLGHTILNPNYALFCERLT